MTKRKKDKIKDAPNLKRFRSEIQSMTKSKQHFPRHGPKQTRKQKRKESRTEKKSRKNAYCRRLPIPSKEEEEKVKNEAVEQQKKDAKLKRLENNKEKKKERKVRQKQKEQDSREEQRKVETMWDDKEIKDLEKKLGLNKRKKKDTLPLSFQTDGLDYILDVVNTEKLQAMMNLAGETEGDDFGLMGDESDEDNNDVDDGDDDDNSQSSDEMNEEHVENIAIKPIVGHDNKRTETNEMKMMEIDKGKEKWEVLADRMKILAEKHNILKKSVSFAPAIEEVQMESSDNGDDDHDGNDEEDEEVDDLVAVNDDNDFSSGEDDDCEDDDDDNDDNGEPQNENSDSDTELRSHSETDETTKRKTNTTEIESDVSGLKEDIYGRLRDSHGNIILDNKPAGGQGAYVPPAKRLQMAVGSNEKKTFMLQRLQKQLKGLINRASENNMLPISGEIEQLYLSNSRADVNESLVGLISEACISPVLTPDRLAMELMMLVAILHGNVGSEVGAVFLQHFAKGLRLLELGCGPGKEMDNAVVLIAHLYNFKVVHSVLIFDILKKLTDSFKEKHIELILLLLRHVGFSLRKDNPSELKDFIVTVQARAASSEAITVVDQSRVRFMLEVIMAIRNNNMRKIPNYDPEHLDHLRKLIRSYIRGGQFGDNQLHISLEDLLNAEEKGKWWLVGSAWDGNIPQQHNQGVEMNSAVLGELEISTKLQDLARKQRMNTDLRRNIFYVIMTSEDFLDAFEKLLRLGVKSNQKQEIILVIMDCCLQEKKYNPFYSYLGQKFCEHHRTYQMAFQFCIWDKFKEISNLSDSNRNNLAKLLNHLIIHRAQSLSILKVISFGTLEKEMVRLLKQLLSELLLDHPQSEVEEVFSRIAQIDKLKQLHEGLRLFLTHFLVGKKNQTKSVKLVERVEIVDRLLTRGKTQILL